MLNRRCSRSRVSPPWRRLPIAPGMPAPVTGAAAAIGAARPAAASSKAAAALRRRAPASSRTGAVLAAVAAPRRPVSRRRSAAAHAPVVHLQRLPAAALQHRAWRTSSHDCGSAAREAGMGRNHVYDTRQGQEKCLRAMDLCCQLRAAGRTSIARPYSSSRTLCALIGPDMTAFRGSHPVRIWGRSPCLGRTRGRSWRRPPLEETTGKTCRFSLAHGFRQAPCSCKLYSLARHSAVAVPTGVNSASFDDGNELLPPPLGSLSRHLYNGQMLCAGGIILTRGCGGKWAGPGLRRIARCSSPHSQVAWSVVQLRGSIIAASAPTAMCCEQAILMVRTLLLRAVGTKRSGSLEGQPFLHSYQLSTSSCRLHD